MNIATVALPFLRACNKALSPRGCLFTFHRGASTEKWRSLPNRDFYLNLEFLDNLLAYLAASGWDIVTLDEATKRVKPGGKLHKKFVNFSVDDCYRDTFEEVVPLFRKHNAPVTLFVTTGIPDATMGLWHTGFEDILLNRNELILEDGTVDISTSELKRAAYLNISPRFDKSEADKFYTNICELNRANSTEIHERHAISWDMLSKLKDDPLVEIGAHTVSHPHVSALSQEAARSEIGDCRQRLQQELGLAVNHFAFPFGRAADCGPRDFELARKAGFVTAATTVKGLLRRNDQLFHLPRNTLNGSHQNIAMIEAHLTGATVLAARMFGRV